MGGNKLNKGQAQRTKNNAKPANSGRLAELVDKSHQFPTFSGSNESRSSFGAPPTAITLDVFSSNVDPNFNVILKKINKKDATTRFKALGELRELCSASSPEVVTEVLAVWARLYSLLAVDVEHRVREAAQEVHRTIVAKVGRQLAPHLKAIAPLWFLSQYDSYPPAASVATAAFQEAFPSHKVPEVIAFCQAEILEYIQGNLLSLTPQTLSKGDSSKEEAELKYERIIICSLSGLALYLSKVPIEQIKKYDNVHKDILSSPKFWKFSKYKTPGVRSAWFGLISALCEEAPYLLELEKKHLANSVIGGIDDADSSVLAAVWEASLRAFSTVQDFWHHINIDKFFLPKFVNILRVGGQGNASFIFPNVLLLLNSIPSDVIKDKKDFFGKIFSKFQEGMKQPLVYQSPSESEAVITSFVECLQFVILKNIDDEEFCNFLLSHLYRMISSSMKEPSFRHQLKPLYRGLHGLTVSWERGTGGTDSPQRYLALSTLLPARLVQLVSEALTESLVDKNTLQICLNAQLQILSVLESSGIVKKPKMKVSFADLSMEDNSSKSSPDHEASSEKTALVKDQIPERVIFLAGFCLEMYYKLALNPEYEQFEVMFVSQCQKLIELFRSQLNAKLQELEPPWIESLLRWIKSEQIPIREVLTMTFDTLSCVGSVGKEQIIRQLMESRCEESLLEGLKLSSLQVNPALKNWLQSDKIRGKILEDYEKLDIADPSSFKIIQSCMLLDKNGDFVIGNPTVEELISRVKEQLSSEDDALLGIGLAVAGELLNNLARGSVMRHMELVAGLLEPLFAGLSSGRGGCSEVWSRLLGLLASAPPGGPRLLRAHLDSTSTALPLYINSMGMQFDVNAVHEALVRLLNSVLKCAESELDAAELLTGLLSRILQPIGRDSAMRGLEELSTMADRITGELPHLASSTSAPSSTCIPPLPESLPFLHRLLLPLQLLASALSIEEILSREASRKSQDGDEEEGESSPTESLSLPLSSRPSIDFSLHLIELAYGLLLLKKMKKYYYCTKEYYSVAGYIGPFERDLRELIQRCKTDQQEKIIHIVTEKSCTEGRFWNQVKGIIVEFLDGTLQTDIERKGGGDEVEEGGLIPEYPLSLTHLFKLRTLLRARTLSTPRLVSEALRIVKDRYKLSFPDSDDEQDDVMSRDYLITSAEVCRLFEAGVSSYGGELSQACWDFARLALVRWLRRSASGRYHSEDYPEFVSLSSAACSLYTTLTGTLHDEENASLKAYREEWKEVFADRAFQFLCKSWERAIEEKSSDLNPVTFLYLEGLCSTLDSALEEEEGGEVPPPGLNHWTLLAGRALFSPCLPLQLSAYHFLSRLIPRLMTLDEGLDESSLDTVSCSLLEERLTAAQQVVTTLLQDYRPGTSCLISPFTDGYSYTLGYLLVWSALLQFSSQAKHAFLYPLWIKEKNLVPPLMEVLLKLLPESVLCYLESSNKRGLEYFTKPPSLTYHGWTSEKLAGMSCWLLTELLGRLPAVVRCWASETEPKVLALLERLVTCFISPHLCAREMEAIRGQQKSIDNMKVLTYPTVGEVVAIYKVEETSTELSIQLTPNYPLSPPRVDIPKAMISSLQTRQWLKQLTIFLTHQNGTIWDGLILWKSNLDKKFEGIEECYICYSVLHTTTHQLPKQSCHTCKKKFHPYCLYKWFSSSNKSTCPICRAIF